MNDMPVLDIHGWKLNISGFWTLFYLSLIELLYLGSSFYNIFLKFLNIRMYLRGQVLEIFWNYFICTFEKPLWKPRLFVFVISASNSLGIMEQELV